MCDYAQESFEKLKVTLLSEPVLVLPDFSKQFILCTDASKYALGAVLIQEDSGGHLHLVAYVSRKLKDAEMRYSVVEKEALALSGESHILDIICWAGPFWYIVNRPHSLMCLN